MSVHPIDDSVSLADVFPGVEPVDDQGAALACELVDRLERESVTENGNILLRDLCALEDWPRQGRPHRNLLLEYLQRARSVSTDAEAAFCAVIGDLLAIGCCDESSASEYLAGLGRR